MESMTLVVLCLVLVVTAGVVMRLIVLHVGRIVSDLANIGAPTGLDALTDAFERAFKR